MNRKRVDILVFPSVEVLDFAAPFVVFSLVRLDENRRREEASPFETVLVAEDPGGRRRLGRDESGARLHPR